MKRFVGKFSLILGLIIFLFLLTGNAQEIPNYVTFSYIISKLTFTSRINHTNEEINSKLIKEVEEKKVDFFLTDDKEKSIKGAQGTDLLIKVIREHCLKSIEEEFKLKENIRLAIEQNRLNGLDEKSRVYAEAEILYQKFLKYRKGETVQEIEIAIKAGREFLEKYADEKKIKEPYREDFIKEYKEVIEYVRKQLPKLEERINTLKYSRFNSFQPRY